MDWRRQIHNGPGWRGDMASGAGGGNGLPVTPSVGIDACNHQSSGAAAQAVNTTGENAGQGPATAESTEATVDRLMLPLGRLVMETLGVSFVTWTAKGGPIETGPARAATVYAAMSAAREAAIKALGAGGDDLDALVRATAAAMRVATAAMPAVPTATMTQPRPTPSQRGWETATSGVGGGVQPRWATLGAASSRLGQYRV